MGALLADTRHVRLALAARRRGVVHPPAHQGGAPRNARMRHRQLGGVDILTCF
eukprot:gene320-22074_t